MKIRSRPAQYTLGALLVMLAVLGVYIADRTYQHEIIIKGVLGSAVLYLLFNYIKFTKTDLSLKDILLEPKVLNHVIFTFIAPMLAYWAAMSVFDMLLFVGNYLVILLK